MLDRPKKENLHIALPGDVSIPLESIDIRFRDASGEHVGRAVEYGQYPNLSTGRTVLRMYRVACDDGVERMLRPHQLRDALVEMMRPRAKALTPAQLGSIRSERKAAASRENGRKGGRPVNPDSARQRRLRGERV